MRALWIALIALLPGLAHAQNLLVSPDFDVVGDIAAWPDPFPDPEVEISWEPPPMDVDGSSSSGSLRLLTTINSGTADGPLQCVAAAPNVTYEAEGWVFTPTQVPQPFPLIELDYFSTPDCTGPLIGLDFQFPTTELDTWKLIRLVIETPPETGSIGFRPVSGNTTDATPVAVFFDALFLPEPDGLSGVALGFALLVALRGRVGTRPARCTLADAPVGNLLP